ncbi:MAG: hypothetical protein ACI9MC_001983 [Kiritimatiellia bacterium]|jgi:hypothetical protein
MTEKPHIGTRFVCYVCSCRFYDMNQEVPKCPECKTDQRKSPSHYARHRFGKDGTRRNERVRPSTLPVAEASDDEDDDGTESPKVS